MVDDKDAVLKQAQIFIEAFGGVASVDAFEASSMFAAEGDTEEAQFWLRVHSKIIELQGC
jgi:hypothetical protein